MGYDLDECLKTLVKWRCESFVTVLPMGDILQQIINHTKSLSSSCEFLYQRTTFTKAQIMYQWSFVQVTIHLFIYVIHKNSCNCSQCFDDSLFYSSLLCASPPRKSCNSKCFVDARDFTSNPNSRGGTSYESKNCIQSDPVSSTIWKMILSFWIVMTFQWISYRSIIALFHSVEEEAKEAA